MFLLRLLPLLAMLLAIVPSSAVVALDVGFGAADVTPQLVDGHPVWLAGLEQNRAATGVHDALWARAIVLRDHGHKFALVSVDSIGLPYGVVQAARKELKDFRYVLVASTHSHASPDVVGIWGPAPDKSGVDPQYLKLVEDGIVAAVRQADGASAPATAEYGTAEDSSLLGDFRLPEVYDGVLRTIRFHCVGMAAPCGILVQWNSHGVEPHDNPLITRDFMGATVDALARRHGCPVVYFQGAIGGLMGTPKKLVEAAKAGQLPSDAFGFIDACGEAIADLADRALAAAEPIKLDPVAVFARPITIPLDNDGFRAAVGAGVLERPIYDWTGNPDLRGRQADADTDRRVALETEVAYLRLGELDVAAIPGELYPECVYGQYQDPADPGADFINAALEPPIAKILPSKRFLVLGLANDEVGYIIPKRQWDVVAPFAYGRQNSQYGERNSVGPDTAAFLLSALQERVDDAKKPTAQGAKP